MNLYSKFARVTALLIGAGLGASSTESLTLAQFHDNTNAGVDYVLAYLHKTIDKQANPVLKKTMNDYFFKFQGNGAAPIGQAEALGQIMRAEIAAGSNEARMNADGVVERAIDMYVREKFPAANVTLHPITPAPRTRASTRTK